METEKIEKLGLTEQQAKVYLKLIELGPSTVGKLIKQLDIARVSCYDTLNRLISRGLVSFVNTRKSRLYQAADPVKLLHLAEEREKEAEKQKTIIQELLPELNKLRSVGEKEEKEASIYKTKEGIKSLFEQMLKVNKPIYVMSATGRAIQEMKYYFPQWNEKRRKNNLRIKVIFNKELKNKKITEIPLSEKRFLPKEYSSPSTLFIFGDYVATLLWSDVPFVFLIKSKEISRSYLNYFEIIWNLAK
jgi:HTH-type transcriptional regulator, sugar sensing transcriptional regulator